MSGSQLFALSPMILSRRIRRWMLRRELAEIARECEFIRLDREHGFALERYLQGREACIRSDLHNI